MSSFTRYFLSSPVGKTGFLDLRLEAGDLVVQPQQATVVGSAQVDWVYASAGTSVDFTASGAGLDVLYLDGALSDYSAAVQGTVLTLSRTVGGVTSTYKIDVAEDKVVFRNGSALASELATQASSLSSVVPDAAETSAALPAMGSVSDSATRVSLASGGVLSVAAGGPQLVVAGTTGVESVHVRAGGQADLRGLGGGTDKIYMSGKWSDYSKAVSANALTLTRVVGDLTEKVVVSAGTGAGNDQLFFADGHIFSLGARTAVASNSGVSLAGAGGVVNSASDSKTPVSLAQATLVDIDGDTADASDFITHTQRQTVTGTFTGQLAAGDKLQVRVGTGSWVDALVSGVTSSGGNFSLAGVDLAEGVNSVQVRTRSAGGLTRAGTGKSVTLDTGTPEATLVIATGQNQYVNSTEEHITLRVTDTSRLQVGDRVKLQLGGVDVVGAEELQVTQALKSSGISWTVAKARLSEGTGNAFTLVARDVAGNSRSSSELAITLDTEVPTPTLSVSDVAADGSAIRGLAGDAYLNAAESAVVFKVALAHATQASQSAKAGDFLQLKVAGADLGARHTLTAEDITRGHVLMTVNKTDLGTAAADGSYQVQVQASDVAGNQSHSAVNLTLDAVAPAATLSLSNTQADGTAFAAGQNNDATLTLAESTFLLKFTGDASVAGGSFKSGDVLVLQRKGADGSFSDVKKLDADGHETEQLYSVTVGSDGALAYMAVTITDLPAGLSDLRVRSVDLAGNSGQSNAVQVNRVVNFFFELPATEITALDVDGQIVLLANSLAGEPSALEAVAGHKIRLVHTTDATRTQEIDVTDARLVTISGNKVIIRPGFDFDFGSSYRVEVDANAFTATVAGVSGTKSRAMVEADALDFGTVSLASASSVANAAQGQSVADDGTVGSGRKWIDGSGQGDWGAGQQVDFDLAGGNYAVVVKDGASTGARPDQGDGVQIKQGFNLRLDNVGAADRIYVDDRANDKAALNNRDFSQFSQGDAGGLDLAFNPTEEGYDGKGGQIHIRSVETGSGLGLTEGDIRGLLNLSNSRLGTRISAIERVGTNASQDYSGALATGQNFEVKVSAALRTGDKVQLVRINASGTEVIWGHEVTVSADDVTRGHLTLSQGTLIDLHQGRNTIYARVTGADGAVTRGPVLFDAQGGLDYDTTAPEPVLSVAAEDDLTAQVSEDASLSNDETSVRLKVEGWSVGDKLQLKLDGVNLGTQRTIAQGDLDDNGQLYLSVNKADLGAAGTKQLTATITDRAGNAGTSASALAVDVLEYVELGGSLFTGPVVEGNDLVVTAYDAAGNVIGQDASVASGAGSYSLKILKSHSGPVLIKVSSTGSRADFMDEGTGAATDLQGHTFFAVTTVSGANVTAHVTPLTDLAAQKLMTGQQLAGGTTAAQVQAANEVVARLFLGQSGADITALTVNPTISDTGAASAGSANLYGQVLEQISRQATGGKTFADVQADLLAGLSWSKDQAVSTAAVTASSAAARAQVLAKVQFNVQSTAATRLDITLDDLTQVGVTGASTLTAARQAALLESIKSATSLSEVGSVDKLQSQASRAVAVGVIQDYAAGGTTAPKLSDYQSAGITGVSATNLVAINAAVQAGGASAVADVSQIQARASSGASDQVSKLALLTAYASSSANPEPTLQDYLLAGVTGVTASNFKAINVVLEGKSGAGDADTLVLLQAIANAGQIRHQAATQILRDYILDDAGNAAPTFDDYRDAGVASVTTAAQATQANTLLRSFPDDRASRSASELSAAIANYASSLDKLKLYGEAGHVDAAATPSASDYDYALVSGVSESNVAAVNSIISALATDKTDTPQKLQEVVTAYQAVARAADGVSGNVSAAVTQAQFAALGLSDISSAGHARLLSDVIDGKAASAVATWSQLQALAQAVAAVFTGAAGGSAPTQSQLELLGFTVADEAALGAMQAAIAATGDDGAGVNTLAKLRAVVANDAPTATDATLSVAEDADLVLRLSDLGFADALDAPAHVLKAVVISALPEVGTLKLDGVAVTAGQSISHADIEAGKLVYRAAPDANGVGYARVSFKVQDDGGTVNGGKDTSASANTLTFNVTPVNDAPTGEISPRVTSLTVGGLAKTDGSASLANGTYVQLSTQEIEALSFGNGFTPDGSASQIDSDKPVYQYTDTSGRAWYLWSRQGSGYHISRLTDTSEWYWEASPTNTFAATPLELESSGNSWVLSDAVAAVVAADMSGHTFAQGAATVVDWATGARVQLDVSGLKDLEGLGTLSYQWQQSVDGSTNWTAITGATAATLTLPDGLTGRYLRAQIRYTDGQGTAETFLTQTKQVADTRAPRLDLDGDAAGSHRSANVATNGEGVNLASKPSVAESGTVNKIEIAVNARDVPLTAGEKLTLVGLSFNLDGADLPASLTVSGVTWTPSYNTTTHTLVLTAAGAGTTAGNIQAMIAGLEYVNASAPSGNRVLTMTVSDSSGNKSNESTTTLTFDQTAPVIDLDTTATGTGFAAAALTSAALAQTGVKLGHAVNQATVTDASELSSVKVSVSGLINGASEQLTVNTSSINADGSLLPATVSDGTSTWNVAYASGSFTFTQASGLFGAASAQALVRALGYKNAAATPSDGVRLLDISASDRYGNVGEAARAKVIINTALPAAAASGALVAGDGNGDGVKGDVFTLNFTERVQASNVTSLANWTLSGGATLGTGATIEAISPLTVDGVQYASSFRVARGTGSTYTTGTTLSIAAANVIDTTGAAAAANIVFTMSDIVAPTARPVPPVTINQISSTSINEINATEKAATTSITFSFASSADNAFIRYYLDGVELTGKAAALTSSATSATLSLSGADWGSDGTHTLTARIEDGAGNLGLASASKTVKVDSSISPGMTVLFNDVDASSSATAGDVVTLVFNEAVSLTSSSLPAGVFGTTAPTPTAVGPVDGKSQTWTVTLGAGATLAAGTTYTVSNVTDQAGNTGTVTGTTPADLLNLPGAPSIATVTSDNVINATEGSTAQAVSINLSRARVGDVVTLFLDGVSVGSATVSTAGQSSIAIQVEASSWGADGERVLLAEVKRGSGTSIQSTEERHVYVNRDSVHWSANKANTLWFDPETLATGASVTSAWTPSVGAATTSIVGTAPTVVRTAEGRLMLNFPTSAGNSNYLSIASTTIGGARPANSASFTAFKLDSTSSASGYLYPIAYGNFADNNGYLYHYQLTTSSNAMAGGNWALNTVVSGGANSVIVGAPTVYSYQVTTTGSTRNAELGVNGASSTVTGITGGMGGTAIIPNTGTNLTIGWGRPAWEYLQPVSSMKGQMGDVIIANSAFTNAEQQEIEVYLASKYRTQGSVVISPAASGNFDLTADLQGAFIDQILDRVQSGAVNDTILTAGSDYVNAGAGADKVHVKDLAFRHIDGGAGNDTLLLAGDYTGSNTIVLADLVSNARGNSGDATADARVNAAGWHKLYGFETIDLSTSAVKQTLTVAAADVNQLSDTNTLGVVLGDNDVLNVTGFTSANPTWGYYNVDGKIYTQRYVDSSGAYTLYAIGGNSQPQLSSASYSASVLTLSFGESLTSSAVLGDWSVAGGATSISGLSQSGVGNSTLTFTLGSITAGSTVRLSYNGTALTDTDGKALRYQEVWVASGGNDTLDASGNSQATALFGNGGSDVLRGGSGSDKLVGGQGNDTLTGGAGADIFAFIKGELSQDVVSDFSKSQGDKLDLSLLLEGAGMDKTSLESVSKYLQLSQSGNNALLKVSVTGSGDFVFADQSLTLTNGWSTGGLNEDIMTLLSNRVILA